MTWRALAVPPTPPAVGLVLLAAGGSARLGHPKQLLEFRGRSLLRHAAETALASRALPVVVVLGAEAERCAVALAGLPVVITINADWREGLAGSIHSGLAALEKSAPAPDAVILAVADQPLLTAQILDTLIAARMERGARVAAAEYAGRPGVPALFAAELFPQLRALRGDQGARDMLRARAAEVARVPFHGGDADVDTAEDFAALGATSP